MPISESINRRIVTHRVISALSFLVSAYFTLKYVGLHTRHFGNHPPSFHVLQNPFSANGFVVLAYWVVLFVNQVFFLAQYYSAEAVVLQDATAITVHFMTFNLLHALWIFLFSHKHSFIWAEIILILNLFNLLSLYVRQKTYAVTPLSKWVSIHLPTAALPLSWVMYAIFWNGAVIFRAHNSTFSRVLANVFIWDFLLAPSLFLILFSDWAIGLSTAVLVFGIALSQFMNKLIALQWIFALVIASTVTVLSLLIAIPSITPPPLKRLTSEAATQYSERAPLLDPNSV